MTNAPEKVAENVSAIPFFHRVIAELQPFLGAQTEAFVRRQCAHIRITPECLAPEHLPRLGTWMQNSARLIMNREKAEELHQTLISLEK